MYGRLWSAVSLFCGSHLMSWSSWPPPISLHATSYVLMAIVSMSSGLIPSRWSSTNTATGPCALNSATNSL